MVVKEVVWSSGSEGGTMSGGHDSYLYTPMIEHSV